MDDKHHWSHKCETPECCHRERHHVAPHIGCSECRAAGWLRATARYTAEEWAALQPEINAVLDSIEADPDPIPDSIADMAAEAGVTEAQLRQALREAHPDASPAEVFAAAREVVP